MDFNEFALLSAILWVLTHFIQTDCIEGAIKQILGAGLDIAPLAEECVGGTSTPPLVGLIEFLRSLTPHHNFGYQMQLCKTPDP